MTKLLENIFRCVNIAMVNELKMPSLHMGIDIWEVIDAAATKPFGFMPFYPGPGLGGHCIPVDPFYLSWKVREHDFSTRFNASFPAGRLLTFGGPAQRGHAGRAQRDYARRINASAVERPATPATSRVAGIARTANGFESCATLKLPCAGVCANIKNCCMEA
jgi:hypothetical protein